MEDNKKISAEILQLHDALDQKATEEFSQLIDKMKHTFLTTHDTIAALSQLCYMATIEAEVRLPMKPFKFIVSSWLCPSLFQIVNEGLVAFNMAHTNFGMLETCTRTIANSMVNNVYCALMLQDVPFNIKASPEFISATRKLSDLSNAVQAKLNQVIGLTSEVLSIMNDRDFAISQTQNSLSPLLNTLLQGCNNSLWLWSWLAETADSFFSNIGVLESNPNFPNQSFSTAHQVACPMFQASALVKVGAAIFADPVGDLLLNMDELATISNTLDVKEKQKTLQQSCMQCQHSFKSDISQCLQIEFKNLLVAAKDYNTATKATSHGYLQVTAVSAAGLTPPLGYGIPETYAVLLGPTRQNSTVDISADPQWEETFPTMAQFELSHPDQAFFTIELWDKNTIQPHEYMGESMFVLSEHLGTKEQVTLTQVVVCSAKYKPKVVLKGSLTIRVEN